MGAGKLGGVGIGGVVILGVSVKVFLCLLHRTPIVSQRLKDTVAGIAGYLESWGEFIVVTHIHSWRNLDNRSGVYSRLVYPDKDYQVRT